MDWNDFILQSRIDETFVQDIRAILKPEQFFIEEPMSRHTTFKIGGPADYLIFPASMQEVTQVFALTQQHGIPLTILGNGSNVLVLDKGIRGAVMKFNSQCSSLRHEGNMIFASAGALLKDVSKYAAACGLTGLEFAVGIPGSIGGAVFMNAGAYDGEMKNVVHGVHAVASNGKAVYYTAAEIDFGYRHSVFQENGQAICEVELELVPGDRSSIEGQMTDLTQRREKKQPLEMPSAGSTFKRPEGHFAGTLIESTGLKGFRVGGAQISSKHAGFVINAGGATAADVLELIHEVQQRVYEKNGVELFPEVRILGEE